MPKSPPPCEYCKGVTTQAMHIDRLGSEPATTAFKCQACGRLTWITAPVKG